MVFSRTPGTTRLGREASGLSDGRGISTGVSPGTMTNTGVPRDVSSSCWIETGRRQRDRVRSPGWRPERLWPSLRSGILHEIAGSLDTRSSSARTILGTGEVYSPPLDQLLPTMHAVVPPLAFALCVFFFGTELGRNTWVHYLATHRTATHRRVRPSMVVVWALLDVSRHFIVRPLTLASPRPGPAHQSAQPDIRRSGKSRLPFRSHGQP